MRNGSGEEMHVLFREDGCAINGFAHEYEKKDKAKLMHNLPAFLMISSLENLLHRLVQRFVYGQLN